MSGRVARFARGRSESAPTGRFAREGVFCSEAPAAEGGISYSFDLRLSTMSTLRSLGSMRSIEMPENTSVST